MISAGGSKHLLHQRELSHFLSRRLEDTTCRRFRRLLCFCLPLHERPSAPSVAVSVEAGRAICTLQVAGTSGRARALARNMWSVRFRSQPSRQNNTYLPLHSRVYDTDKTVVPGGRHCWRQRLKMAGCLAAIFVSIKPDIFDKIRILQTCFRQNKSKQLSFLNLFHVFFVPKPNHSIITT